ncbi:MAG: hypothetical protein D6772_03350 [Bacteroidetes bacterium]|nr:MAG: hypothetical protein D6772_03350 [Bacteroidota bacterium]
MTRALSLFILSLLLWHCQPKPKPFVLMQSWRSPLFLDPRLVGESIYPIATDDAGVVVARLLGNQGPVLLKLAGDNGCILWQYQDTSLHQPLYYNLEAVVAGSRLVLPFPGSTRCFDLHSGALLWQIATPGGEPFLASYTKDYCLQSINDKAKRESYVLRIALATGDTTRLYTQRCPAAGKCFLRTSVTLRRDRIAFSSSSMELGTNQTQSKWLIFDLVDAQVIHRGMAYRENNKGWCISKQGLVNNQNLLWLAKDEFFCVDTETGKERWRYRLARDMLSSCPLVDDGYVYLALEDGQLYKLSLTDGRLIWQTTFARTPSRLLAHAGRIYGVGGHDGQLYIFDQTKGQLIQKVEAPNAAYYPEQYYRRFIGTDQTGEYLFLFDGNSVRAYR